MKKGFTLIEVVVVISIIIIFSSLSILSISNYKKFINEIDSTMAETMILGIINDGKQYCRENKKSGYIVFDAVKNEVRFYSDEKRVDAFKLPSNIAINSINTKQNKIDIDRFGFTSDAGTITMKDKNGNLHKLTINVGAGYAEIK